jgi:hypothetical protein
MRLRPTNYHQRGENIMAQGVLSFQYEPETSSKQGFTALAGLPLYQDLAAASGLIASIRKHMQIKSDGQGWSDDQIIMSLIMLNLAGGECVDDLRILESDEGFSQILKEVETFGLPRAERRALIRRWRKARTRTVPSPSAVFRYIAAFHDAKAEEKRLANRAFIPDQSEPLRALLRVHADFLSFVQQRHPVSIATLDMDATLVASEKENAKYCYKGFKSYQPFNTYWAEQDLIVHSEFRDGNVPAGFEQKRVFEEALKQLPEGVEKVYLRSDTAGYQHDLLKYCAKGEHEKFKVIEFAIGAPMSRALQQAVEEVSGEDWQPLPGSQQEWAEVCFVPEKIAHSKKGPAYRYVAVREPLQQESLPGLEEELTLPFPTMNFDNKGRYKVTAIVTNRDLDGPELIQWYRNRCGKSEEVHSIMKGDLAGGKLPSGDFGENAAWWSIMLLALNLNAAMRHLVLDKSWKHKRLKAIRFSIINIAGRVVERSRMLELRIKRDHPAYAALLAARRKILEIAQGLPPAMLPSG